MRYKILIGLVWIIGFGMIGGSILIGLIKRDVTVVENPYEEALRFDEQLRKSAELGWKVELPVSIKAKENLLKIGVFDKEGRVMDDATVECLVNKCGETMTRNYRGIYDGKGYYQTSVSLDNATCIEVKTIVTRASNTMSFTNKVYIER